MHAPHACTPCIRSLFLAVVVATWQGHTEGALQYAVCLNTYTCCSYTAYLVCCSGAGTAVSGGVSAHDRCAGRRRYVDDEIQARNIDSPFRVDGAIIGLFDALLTLKEEGKSISKLLLSVEMLAQVRPPSPL